MRNRRTKASDRALTRVMGVLCDGRARSVDQIVDEAASGHASVKRALTDLSNRGDVEISIVGGNWLYAVTRFNG